MLHCTEILKKQGTNIFKCMLFLKVLLFFLILWFLRPDSWFSNAWDWQFPKIQHIFFLASWVPQDSSGQESLCISPLEPLSPAVLNTIFHLPFRWKRFLPVLQVLLHPFIHHLSVEMDKVWQATFIFKDIFSNISHIYTCISAAYTQRHIRRLGDQAQEQQWMPKDSQDLFLPDCLVLVPNTSPQPEIWWSWMFWRILLKAANITLKIKKSMKYYF